MKTTKGRPPPRTGSLTALLSSNAAAARGFTPSQEVLTRWYSTQCEALRNHVAALREALEEAYEELPIKPGEGVK